MRFDVRYLDTFTVVFETGGFRRAAEQLHLSQPAVSHRIQVLEGELGLELFERRGRRLVATEAGERLYAWAVDAFAGLAALQAELAGGSPGSGRPETLVVTSVSGFGRYVLFPLLADPEFDGLRLDLRYGTALEVFDRVESGACHIGFAYHAKPSRALRFRTAYVEEIALVVAADAGLDAAALDDPAAFAELPFVTYDESDYVFGAWFDAVYGVQPRTISSVHHFEELEEVVAMVDRGEGVSIVPADAVRSAVREGRARIVRPAEGRCFNDVYAVTPRSRPDSAPIEKALALLERCGGRPAD